MDLLLEALDTASAPDRDSHRPMFFRLTAPADRARLEELLKREPHTVVHDELHSQLRELVRTLNPSVRYTTEELDQAAVAHLKGQDPRAYGVWVHYPWSARLVHLLDEHEFVRVRTDRNRNKITADEQALLATKRIGVIGLSVGQSICLTLALERSFGELRIADFDTLELSNLNRIRSGTHAMGHLKTVNVAREIAEIDPFLNVTLFNEGVTRENIERFCLQGGKLDMLVDECDGVDVKILCRQKAKELRIPVLMDTSDRGMLDVERFDLEPDRPILHGLIDHLDPNDAAKARTNEEKLPFILPLLNLDTLSTRMKASMLEIETSTVTWPQLASSVVLGGALGAEYCRRIALGTSSKSGRWFLDMESLTEEHLLSVDVEQVSPGKSEDAPMEHADMIILAEMVRPDASENGRISPSFAHDLAEAGALAPSGGNNQPWRFLLHQGCLFLFHDLVRSYSALDRGRLIPLLGLGACVENILLKGSLAGYEMAFTPFPLTSENRLVGMFSLAGKSSIDPLAKQIAVRCTNRRKPSASHIDPNELNAIIQVVEPIHGCAAYAVHGVEAMERAANLVGSAERIRLLNPIGHREFFGTELRWSAEEAECTRDGLDIRTMELKHSERAALEVSSDKSAVGLLRAWGNGKGFEKLTGDAIRHSGAVVLIASEGDDALHILRAGRAAQRIWLKATELGFAAQPISAPIFLNHHIRSEGSGFSAPEQEELSSLLDGVRDLFILAQQEPMFMLRLGRADEPSMRSLRLPIERLLHIHEPVTV